MLKSSSQSSSPGQVPEKGTEPNPVNCIDDDLRSSLATKDSLAAALTKQGRYDEAGKLLQEVLATREKLGQSKTNSDMLCTLNNLGAVLSHQDRFAEAEVLHRQVLESEEQRLGSEHPNIITSMHNLASVLSHQDKLEDARELEQRALDLSRKVRGPEMPETLHIMGSLGNILLGQNKYEQAEAVSREVLALRRKVLRDDHPDIPLAMHNLASVLRKQGKLDEAEELRRQEAALRQADVKKVASEKSDAAGVPASRGHYDEVEQRLQDKVKSAMDASGRNDWETRASMSELGVVLIRNGKYKEAESVLRDVLVAGAA